MGWLRLVGSLKLQVSFAEYRLFYRALLQKRHIILRSLLETHHFKEPTNRRHPTGLYQTLLINLEIDIFTAEYRPFYRALLQKRHHFKEPTNRRHPTGLYKTLLINLEIDIFNRLLTNRFTTQMTMALTFEKCYQYTAVYSTAHTSRDRHCTLFDTLHM